MEAPTTTAPAAVPPTTISTAVAATVRWFLHYCMIFKAWNSHSLTLWTFMKYIGASNAYGDQGIIIVHTT